MSEEQFRREIVEYGYEPFEVISENWCIYRLADGTYLKMKLDLIKVVKFIDDSGNINYTISSNNTVGIIPPRNLRGSPATKPYSPQELTSSIVEDDIEFTTVKEEWSKYRLSDGVVLSIKFIPIKVSKTNKFDSSGEPLYMVNHHILLKATLPKELQKKMVKLHPTFSGRPSFIT